MVTKDLPKELLISIFLCAVAQSPATLRENVDRSVASLKETVEHLHGLWKQIEITAKRLDSASFGRLLHVLEIHLRRCGPLTIDVHWDADILTSHTMELLGTFERYAPFPR
ncbi:SubName: Full=Uncharacterized protein {ECO:0000313/EMBL:CCA75602.1} [Serendipita indica DSM 11827]|nr:SubName: Full=Uncharacterized protein {ECO:0000313/EMBL:CCA75602.1} [Serendipita indica DSM 11827]